MEDNNQLNYSWLGGLSNANHDGTTQQIDDTAANFETENQKYNQMAAAVHQARVHEDEVWQKSLVDPVVKQLEAADKQQDCYMTAFRYINDGYASLPDTEREVVSMYFGFHTKREYTLDEISACTSLSRAAAIRF